MQVPGPQWSLFPLFFVEQVYPSLTEKCSSFSREKAVRGRDNPEGKPPFATSGASLFLSLPVFFPILQQP